MTMQLDLRLCHKCVIFQPRDAFYRASRNADGLRTSCRACDAEYRRSPARAATIRKHQSTSKRHAALSRYNRSEKGKENARRFVRNRRERFDELQRTYRQSERGRAMMARRNCRHRARVAGVPNTLTASEWKAIRAAFGGRCAYCQSEARLHRDHVHPLLLGGPTTAENTVPACQPCNSSKQSRILWDEWSPQSPHPELLRRFPQRERIDAA